VRQAADTVRVVVGSAALAVLAAVVRSGTVGPLEATVFRVINRLPRQLGGPVWLVMQGGSLAGAFVTSGGAYLAGQRGPARDLLVSGVSAWLSAKLVKPLLGRGRPAVLLADVIVRHSPASGLGFPSGHAAVAAALATTAASWLPRRYRCPAWAETGLVATARVYEGAHLPLDVLGGAVLGSVLASASRLGSEVLASTVPRRRGPHSAGKRHPFAGAR
jgi:membrane-associated phospholipid phosphatase